MTVVISSAFIDFDGETVRAGVLKGASIVRMGSRMGVRIGYSDRRRYWFWNILHVGRVYSVTLGRPPNCSQQQPT